MKKLALFKANQLITKQNIMSKTKTRTISMSAMSRLYQKIKLKLFYVGMGFTWGSRIGQCIVPEDTVSAPTRRRGVCS